MPSFSVAQLLPQSLPGCFTLASGYYSDFEFHDTGCDDETNIFARPAAVNYLLRDPKTVCSVPMVGIMRDVQLQARGQGKHGFAAHRRGACSHPRCGESPRALGQRVSAKDC
ncbi:unnamed protein product [Polarella glacialis]|uniref:Uncharacterized protein n=1 Tax=Polarella glacialis TaxID=89957 RepID=A0A813JT29_POLGL|nr:unnamed protein product [Polarella glacialis]